MISGTTCSLRALCTIMLLSVACGQIFYAPRVLAPASTYTYYRPFPSVLAPAAPLLLLQRCLLDPQFQLMPPQLLQLLQPHQPSLLMHRLTMERNKRITGQAEVFQLLQLLNDFCTCAVSFE
ncbi:unnamed protein product, partial [Mesorhabditis belari]|uniref:Secreted protein n=1 Tax=Mesorhabditis belari TaxID=2138241 RepID=A0AAF3EVU8_9BILA